MSLCIPSAGWARSTPDWVERGGSSINFPTAVYLTGFAKAEGKQDALESAKQLAIADLARQISVQIESNLVDVTTEANGKFSSDITSQIRATSDIRIEGIRFETYRKRKKVWVLAILEKLPAAFGASRTARPFNRLNEEIPDRCRARRRSGAICKRSLDFLIAGIRRKRTQSNHENDDQPRLTPVIRLRKTQDTPAEFRTRGITYCVHSIVNDAIQSVSSWGPSSLW